MRTGYLCLLTAGWLGLVMMFPAPAVAQVVYSWGANPDGQLGVGTSSGAILSPTAVSTSGVLNGKSIAGVAGGGYHSLAVDTDGQAYAWGGNYRGELGDNSTASSTVPVTVFATDVLSGKTIVQLAGGRDHSLALTTDGGVYAWGGNDDGQLGNSSQAASTVPVAVVSTGALNGKTVTQVAAGGFHSLAIADGRAYAWGNNQFGPVGNGSTDLDILTPVAVNTAGVLGGKTITRVAGGTYHSLAVSSDGSVFSWGDNSEGQLGNGTNGSNQSSNLPVAVVTSGALDGLTVTDVAAGSVHSLAIAGGRVYAWGGGQGGQLGNGTNVSSNVPVAVTSAILNSLTVTDITATQSSSFALTSTGRLFSWGANGLGQLGLGNQTDFNTPQEVFAPAGYHFTSIEADALGTHVLATLVSVPASADFDFDGDVDGRDFLVWQRGNSPDPLSAGDLQLWQQQYGNGSLAASRAVPEPTAFTLLGSALVIAAGYLPGGKVMHGLSIASTISRG